MGWHLQEEENEEGGKPKKQITVVAPGKKAREECGLFLDEQSQQEASMTRECVFIEDHRLDVVGERALSRHFYCCEETP